MSNSSYFVEFAKSGRSKCKKCKEKIDKDDLRIMVEVPGESFNTTMSYHPPCFSLPRKFAMGAGKITVEDFVTDYLEDKTGGDILPSKKDELCAAIESKAPKAGGAKDSAESGDDLIGKLKEAHKALEEGKEPSAKKIKKEKDQELFSKQVDMYGKYHKYKNDAVKDILGWNRQVKTGTKDFLLAKLIDGCIYGRLARCKLCGGRLKLKEDGVTVICGGSFDEDSNMRIDCAFKSAAKDAPRCQPWYMEEPSEEANEEMDRLEAEARGDGPAPSAESDTDVAQLIKGAKALDWNLNNREGLRAAAKDMIALLSKQKKGKKVDLPEDAVQARQRVGQLIATNKDKSAEEIVPLIVKEFGFLEDKQDKSAKKKEIIKGAVANPANAPLVAAFQELSELYFKSGNANAGATYTKVVKALSDLKYEITETNAKGLGKGKTKVDNIGKSSADKIYEFCTTGTMQKLEEKRADVA